MLRREQRLEGVHPKLVGVVLAAAPRMPFDLIVLEGLRTPERQKKLFDAGASRTMNSRHLTGHAVDLAPLIDADGDGDLEVSWAWPLYHQIAPVMKQVAAELAVPIQWGGDWRSFKDGPHWELPWTEFPV